MRLLFNKFSGHYELWNQAVQCSATLGTQSTFLAKYKTIFYLNFLDISLTLDVLLSLAQYSASYPTCRPIVTSSDKAHLEIKQGSHPTVLPSFSNGGFIPNDTVLGGEHVSLSTNYEI